VVINKLFTKFLRMKKVFILFLILICLKPVLYAQKMNGYGAELTILGLNANSRFWVNKTHGVEPFAGIASEISNIKFNDLALGLKYLYALQYRRTDRTYVGFSGKYKMIDLGDNYTSTNLFIPGFIVGKEWYSKRVNRKGFAIELGYQYGNKTYTVTDPTGKNPRDMTYTEFPLIVNLRYSFYEKR